MTIGRIAGALVAAGIALAMALPASAQGACNIKRLENFLSKRAFELSADIKIDLYADQVLRYYDDRNISRDAVYRSMRDWEQRWPERIYRFMRVRNFEKTDDGGACSVTFDYRFLAYSPERDRISAGLGRTTLVLADVEGDRNYLIVGEFGSVLCRGLTRFAKSRC